MVPIFQVHHAGSAYPADRIFLGEYFEDGGWSYRIIHYIDVFKWLD